MTLAAWFRIFLLLTVVLSLTAYTLAEEQPVILVVLVALAVTGWWVTERRAGSWRGLPRWMSSLILLGMAGAAALAGWSGIQLVSVFAGFLTSIIILKLWELRQLRDYGQLLTMSLFLTVAATLTNNSFLLGLTLLIQLPIFVATVLFFQLYSAHHRAREALPSASSSDAEDQQTWRSLRLPLTGVAIASIIVSVGVAIVVFLFIPRGIGIGELGNFARPSFGKQTGFSDRVEPGSGGIISESQATVMEVDVWMRDARHRIGSADEHLYLRGAVLDRYERGVWTRSPTNNTERFRNSHPERGQSTVISVEPRNGATRTTEVRVRQPNVGETPVFHLYRPIDVSFFENEGGTDITYDMKTGSITRLADGGFARYQVRSAAQQDVPDQAVQQDAPPLREATSYPSQRVTQLASELLRQAGYDPDPVTRPQSDDAAATRVFETHLKTRFAYALDIGEAPRTMDATEWFLFTAKRGHCEYFASALAALCRASGIDARVIAGYVATEFDPRRQTYIVRAANAHAWVEVKTGPSQWQVRDGTPESNFESLRAASSGLFGRLSRALDSLQLSWNTRVVSFDNTTQQRLFSSSGMEAGPLDGVVNRMRRFLRDMRRGDARRNMVAAGLKLGLIVAGIGLLTLGWRLISRRVRRPSRRGPGWAMTGPERDLYRAWVRALRRHGFQKPAWQPPLAFLADLRSRNPVLAASAEPPMALLYSIRFGGATAEPGALKTALRSTEQI